MSELGDRIKQLREKAGLSQGALGKLVGMGQQGIHALESGRAKTSPKVMKIARVLKVDPYWLLEGKFEHEPSDAEILTAIQRVIQEDDQAARFEPNARPAPHHVAMNRREMPKDLPVLGIGEGGPDGTFFFDSDATPIDYVRRPPRLEGVKDAYALYVQGVSMRPWREEGQVVMVAPRVPALIGDYVAVQLRDEEHAKAGLIKRLAKKTPKEIHLEQYNPPKVLVYPINQVVAVHKIIDWSELIGI